MYSIWAPSSVFLFLSPLIIFLQSSLKAQTPEILLRKNSIQIQVKVLFLTKEWILITKRHRILLSFITLLIQSKVFVCFCIFQSFQLTLVTSLQSPRVHFFVVVCHYFSYSTHENLKGKDHEMMQELEEKQVHKGIMYYFFNCSFGCTHGVTKEVIVQLPRKSVNKHRISQ